MNIHALKHAHTYAQNPYHVSCLTLGEVNIPSRRLKVGALPSYLEIRQAFCPGSLLLSFLAGLLLNNFARGAGISTFLWLAATSFLKLATSHFISPQCNTSLRRRSHPTSPSAASPRPFFTFEHRISAPTHTHAYHRTIFIARIHIRLLSRTCIQHACIIFFQPYTDLLQVSFNTLSLCLCSGFCDSSHSA